MLSSRESVGDRLLGRETGSAISRRARLAHRHEATRSRKKPERDAGEHIEADRSADRDIRRHLRNPVFSSGFVNPHIAELEGANRMAQEIRALATGLDEVHPNVREENRQWDSRKACAAPDVDENLRSGQKTYRCEGVDYMTI